MNGLYLCMAFLIGTLISTQGPVNSALRASIGSTPVLAAFVSFLGGATVLAVTSLLVGERWGSVAQLPKVPTWQLTGGALGAAFVFGTAFLVPRIGAATTMSLVIAGQIVSALFFDHLGLMGLAPRPLTGMRVGGAVLVIVGVILVNALHARPALANNSNIQSQKRTEVQPCSTEE